MMLNTRQIRMNISSLSPTSLHHPFRQPPPRIHAATHAQSSDSISITPSPGDTNDDLASSWQLLEEFTRKEARGGAHAMMNSPEKRRLLKVALLQAASHPWPDAGYAIDTEILLGVLASDIRLGIRSLRDYCVGLGIDFVMPTSRVPDTPSLASITTPVYIKFNSKTELCYVTLYSGRDRGVLVNLGMQQFGHLPLGIFDEDMKAEGPRI